VQNTPAAAILAAHAFIGYSIFSVQKWAWRSSPLAVSMVDL
jgi:hypothetical protein